MRRYRHIGTQYFSYIRRYFCLFTLFRSQDVEEASCVLLTFFYIPSLFPKSSLWNTGFCSCTHNIFVANIDYTKKSLALRCCSKFEIIHLDNKSFILKKRQQISLNCNIFLLFLFVKLDK